MYHDILNQFIKKKKKKKKKKKRKVILRKKNVSYPVFALSWRSVIFGITDTFYWNADIYNLNREICNWNAVIGIWNTDVSFFDEYLYLRYRYL